MQEVNVGDVVIYTDSVRVEFRALVTAIWSQGCINVVYVAGDQSKTDSYGRQIERATSVCRHSEGYNFGSSFHMLDEEVKYVVHPQSK